MLGLAGVGLLLQLEAVRVPVGLAGVAYLVWLAIDSWRAANDELALDEVASADASRRALRSGVLLSLTNPQNLAYWAALGSAMGAVGVVDPQARDYGVFFAGFMASSTVWAFAFAAFVDRAFRRVGTRWATLTYRACAIAFLLLAAASLKSTLSGRTDAVDAPTATDGAVVPR